MTEEVANPVSIELPKKRAAVKRTTIRDLYRGIVEVQDDKIIIAKKAKKDPANADILEDASVDRLKQVYWSFCQDNPPFRMGYFTSRIGMLYTQNEIDAAYRTIEYALTAIKRKWVMFGRPLLVPLYHKFSHQMEFFLCEERRMNFNLFHKVELTPKMVTLIESVREMVHKLLRKINKIMEAIEDSLSGKDEFAKVRNESAWVVFWRFCGGNTEADKVDQIAQTAQDQLEKKPLENDKTIEGSTQPKAD